jgi:hypothetical protein
MPVLGIAAKRKARRFVRRASCLWHVLVAEGGFEPPTKGL